MKLQRIAFVAASLIAAVAGPVRGELSVSSDFENGSAVVDGIDQASATIRFHPAGDPQRGWPCWWYFRVDGITPGQTVQVEIDRTTGKLPIGTGAGSEGKPLDPVWSRPTQAVFSTDSGKTWRRTETGVNIDGRRRYAAKIDAASALFAWGPVFTPTDGAKLIEQAAKEHSDWVTPFELAKTREGRAVPAALIRAGKKPDAERYGVWIQARQHAWESGGSWVGVGLFRWLTSDDPRAARLRENAVVYYVPVMDVDSVATGNGGKGQNPQDHNRDWSAKPHFPEVAAAQKKILELNAEGRFDYFIDLHNPGAGEPKPYFFSSPPEELSELGRRNLDRFITAARAEINGPLPLEAKQKVSGAAYSPKWREISKNWVVFNTRPHVVALTLETAWNAPASTQEGYQIVGKQLGLAIEKYLQTSPRTATAE